jgi:hypothetical protein
LVPPMFSQDVRGIGLAREVRHQDILWCYRFSNMMEGRLCSLACGWVKLKMMVLLLISKHVAHVPDQNA